MAMTILAALGTAIATGAGAVGSGLSTAGGAIGSGLSGAAHGIGSALGLGGGSAGAAGPVPFGTTMAGPTTPLSAGESALMFPAHAGAAAPGSTFPAAAAGGSPSTLQNAYMMSQLAGNPLGGLMGGQRKPGPQLPQPAPRPTVQMAPLQLAPPQGSSVLPAMAYLQQLGRMGLGR